jgi:hypothetical protein
MSYSYDPTDLNTTTASGRLNSVRLLVGDTDTNDQQVQDEEIEFGLSQNGNNIYYAAAWIARTISSKFARQVNIDVDGQISADYSDLSEQYASLADRLEYQGKKTSGAMGMVAGGLSRTEVDAVRSNTDRVKPAFNRDQFNNPPNDDTFDYYQD